MIKVSIREFRKDMSRYLNELPVMITKRGIDIALVSSPALVSKPSIDQLKDLVHKVEAGVHKPTLEPVRAVPKIPTAQRIVSCKTA